MSISVKSGTAVRGLVLLAALVATACGGGGGGGFSSGRGYLVGGTELVSLTKETITAEVDDALPGYSATYDVTCRQIVYKTPAVNSALIDASALLCLPHKAAGASSPILSYDHGTIFADSQTPSALTSEYLPLGFAAAGLGYVTVMPDYIGYGISKDQPHPYVHAQTLASATVDAVRATRHYLQQQGIATNGKLFLTGYSEGGFAAFATQRSMEQEFPNEFAITASVPGAGPYSLLQTATDVLNGATLASSAYVAEIIYAYDTIYNTPSQLSHYFKEPHDTLALTAFDGSHDGMTIEGQFSHTTATLLNEPFLSDFRGDGETVLKAHLAENNLHDTWIPQSKTRLYHGQEDEIVPYANAQAVASHAAGHDVEVVDCTAGMNDTNHSNCAMPYWEFAIGFFATLDPGL